MSENKPRYTTLNAFTDDEWRALDDAYGDTRRVTGAIPPPKPWAPNPEPKWEAIFRRPSSAETNVFEKHVHNDGSKSQALRLLAKAIVVGVANGQDKVMAPDPNDTQAKKRVQAAWDSAQEKHGGGLHMAAQTDVMDLAGMGREIEGKE